jgi:hypothetical protein
LKICYQSVAGDKKEQFDGEDTARLILEVVAKEV